MPNNLKLKNAREAADYLGICRNFLYILVREGHIPRVIMGARTIRFRPQDLDAFIKARMARGGKLAKRLKLSGH